MRIELWNGIYFDEHGFQRECVIVTVRGGPRVSAIDKLTKRPILDPPSAIPVSPMENRLR